MIPTIFGLLVIALGFWVGNLGVLTLSIICTMFGATAAAFLTAMGGAPVNPALMALPFVIWYVSRSRGIGSFGQALEFDMPGFWLIAFSVWAVISAFLNPRLFAGEVNVFVVDRFIGTVTARPGPLGPVSTNITQAGYVLTGLLAYCAFVSALGMNGAKQKMMDAMLWLAGLHALAGMITLAQWLAGLPDFLSILKNANYAVLSGEVGGLVRITGTLSEAAAYAGLGLPLFAFTQALFLTGYRRSVSGPIALTLLALLLLSTSSTAYGGLALCGMVAFSYALWSVMSGQAPNAFRRYLLLPGIAVLVVAVAALFLPSLVEEVWHFLDIVIGKKLDSQSGVERSTWNRQAIQNFFDTFMLGTGLGSNHASSWPVLILSNLGWIGGLMFSLFYWRLFRAPAGPVKQQTYQMVCAAKCALIAHLAAATLSARVFDPGVLFFMLAAMVNAGLVHEREGPPPAKTRFAREELAA